MKLFRLIFATAFLCLTGFAADWQTLEHCRLLPNQSNDGDSFHVEHAGHEYIFRLYYVDTPETDNDFPDRVAVQAAYFGVTPKRAIELGHAATDFTARALAEPFTVLTRWQDARGRSKLPRHYAFIQTRTGGLADLLVQNGLARVFGEKAILPNGTSTKSEELRLLTFERQAKAAHAGGWGGVVAQPCRLFIPSGERHNAHCPFFHAPNTRPCPADEGKACRICGG